MSLIIEAIRKAQELRLKKGEDTPFFQAPGPRSKKKTRAKKYFWMVSVPALGLALLFLIPGKDPLPQRNQPQESKVASVAEKPSPSPSAAKKESPEVFREKTSLLRSAKPRAPGQISGEGKREMTREPKVERVESPPEAREIPDMVPPPERTDAEEAKDSLPVTQATSAALAPPPAPALPEPSQKSFALEKQGEKHQPTQAGEVLAHFNRGVRFYRQRETTQALQSYQKVIELDPAHVEAYNNLGILYQELGDLRRAQEAYQKALEINPRYEKAQNNLGILFYLSNRYEESIAAFQKALALNPRNIESYCNLGALYMKIGQTEKAVECYQKALAINPLHGETHYNLGLLHEHAERMEPAIYHYRKFMQLSSKTHPDLVAKVQRNIDRFMLSLKDRRKGTPSPSPLSSPP